MLPQITKIEIGSLVVELQSVTWSKPVEKDEEDEASEGGDQAEQSEGSKEPGSSKTEIVGAECDEDIFSTKAVQEHSICYLVVEPKMGEVTLWHHEHSAFW
jgi:hypothetical protein